MLSSRSLALRRQLPSLVRHQSTKIPGWRQFSEDIRDAERRGTLRAPPSNHPFPPLWRCKELGLFYQRGIVKTWKAYKAARAIDSREHFKADRATIKATEERAKLIYCPLLPFAAFVPNIIFPVSCILPAQMDRYFQEALRLPPSGISSLPMTCFAKSEDWISAVWPWASLTRRNSGCSIMTRFLFYTISIPCHPCLYVSVQRVCRIIWIVWRGRTTCFERGIRRL
ncbi:hypothetical protein BDZ89DRAFT_647435 [Hymenopellis radicata]|nr:hypothetical protein BDZ89DRAFT_647435 [Hymenopellis radicata]